MAKLAISTGRNRVGEENDSGNSEYVQLSLEGRWVALAGRWLQRNCPCSVEKYYYEVVPLMPAHIAVFRRRTDAKMAAAKAALRRFANSKGKKRIQIKLVGGMLEMLHNLPTKNYNFPKRFPLIGCSIVDMNKMQFQSTKEKYAFREYLSRQGFVCTARNVLTRISINTVDEANREE